MDELIRQYSSLGGPSSEVAAEAANRSQAAEIDHLTDRLSELQGIMASMVPMQQPLPMQDTTKVEAADQLLAEMSEQLRLQKELHLRRKELEELMKKDILDR